MGSGLAFVPGQAEQSLRIRRVGRLDKKYEERLLVMFGMFAGPEAALNGCAGPDRRQHAIQDKWTGGATLRARVGNTPGAAEAVEKGARLLALVNSGAPRSQILGFLKAQVFLLVSP